MGTTRPPEVKLFTVFVYLPQTAPTPPTPPLLCPLSKNMPFTDTLHPAIKMPGGSTGEGVCSAFPSSLSSRRSQIFPVSGERESVGKKETARTSRQSRCWFQDGAATFSVLSAEESLADGVTPGLRDSLSVGLINTT